MILTWIAYAMFCAAAMAAVGACLDFAVGGRLRARRALWAVVLLAAAAGPVVGGVLVPPPSPAPAPSSTSAALVGTPASSPSIRAIAVPNAVTIGVWAVVSGVVLLGLGLVSLRLDRRLRGCRHEVVAGHSVLVSEEVGPAVVGLFRARIVLPDWVMTLPEEERALVVAHEAEHIRASDHRLSLVALVLVALLPWNLALWWILRRLRLAIELDCDGRVVHRTQHDPQRYCELLVAAREHTVAYAAPSLTLAPLRSALGKRVEAILNPRPANRPASRFAALTTSVGLTAVVAMIPAAPLGSVEPKEEIPTVATATAFVPEAPATALPETPRPTAQQAPRPIPQRSVGSPSLPGLTAMRTGIDDEARKVDPVLKSPELPRPAGGVIRAGGIGGGRGGRGGFSAPPTMTARPVGTAVMTANPPVRPDTIPPFPR